MWDTKDHLWNKNTAEHYLMLGFVIFKHRRDDHLCLHTVTYTSTVSGIQRFVHNYYTKHTYFNVQRCSLSVLITHCCFKQYVSMCSIMCCLIWDNSNTEFITAFWSWNFRSCNFGSLPHFPALHFHPLCLYRNLICQSCIFGPASHIMWQW